MMNVANSAKGGRVGGAEAFGAGIGLFFWAMIWFIPFVGMGIIALITRPKTSARVDTAFCGNCGANVGQQGRFCPSCGIAAAPARATSPPSRKKQTGAYVAIAVGLLLLMVMCNALVKEPASTTTSASSSTPTSQSNEAKPVSHKLGEDVFTGYWAYRCISARWQRSIGSEYTAQYPDARFLVVDIAIRNNDKTASTLPPLKLVDDEGREYDESSKAIFMENSLGMLKSVNPGVSSRGYVAFDVPTGKYKLKVSGGYTSGESVLIDLP
jgi:hypothetical protein